MLNCKVCKLYKGCIGKEFYTYSDIRWCPLQILWIISNAEILGAGNWPPDPEGSSYTDPGIKTGYKSEGYYVKPVGIIAEVEYRLKRCGVDGKLLRAEVLAELELSQESKSALHYCKGWRRKRMSYVAWKKKVKYQKRLPKSN